MKSPMRLEMSPEIEFLGTWRPTSTDTITGIELVPVSGSRHIESKVFPAHTTISIGRVPSSDPSRFEQYPERADYFCPVMSRKHASISFSGSRAYITDTASHHGTFIERETSAALKVEVDERVALEDGDRITFGRPVHKGGKDHLPITIRVKLLTTPFVPHFSASPPLMPNVRRSTYGLFEDDEEEDIESVNHGSDGILDPSDRTEEVQEITRCPPGAWPIDSPIYEEPITPPPFFYGALSVPFATQVGGNGEFETLASQPQALERPQAKEALSKLKADIIKLQLNRKRMKARLTTLEKQSSKIARLNDISDQVLRDDQQQYHQGIDGEISAVRERLHALEERMAETDYNAAVDGLSSRNLGAEVRNVVNDDSDSALMDKTREEITTARHTVQSLLSELAAVQRTVETQLQRLEMVAIETRKRERDVDEGDAAQSSPPLKKRARTVGEFALATAVGAAMVWTGLALS